MDLISKLTLGTVQFGLPYGIANQTGRPSYESLCDILRCAYEGGVRSLDTAASYGESEIVLGRALEDLGLRDRMTVMTKILRRDPWPNSDREAREWIEKSVNQSLARLRVNHLSWCLFHTEADARYLDILLELKAQGLVEHVGVSVAYGPTEAGALLESGQVDALQVAASVLDPRHARAGIISRASRQGVCVFTRSLYLQGLLFLPEARIPAPLNAVIPVRRALAELAQGAGMTLGELAFRYMLGQPGITSILVGVDTREQMMENLELWKKGPLPADMRPQVESRVPDLSDDILLPFRWPKSS